MPERDDDIRTPRASIRRPASTGTMTISALGDLNVALAEIRGRLDTMAQLQREQNEDIETGFRSVGTGLASLDRRIEDVERATAHGSSQASGAIESLTASMASFTSQLEASHAQNAEHRALFMKILEEDREINRKREEAEQERRREERAAKAAREEEERKAAEEAAKRKEQWLLRFCERAKQPMLMIMMAAAGAIVALFGRC